MDSQKGRDWRDCVPRHIRLTGWGAEIWTKKEREWQSMEKVTVFRIRQNELIEIRYGYRGLGGFLGLRGERLQGAWEFPHEHKGYLVEVAGAITKKEYFAILKQERRAKKTAQVEAGAATHGGVYEYAKG